MPAILSLVPGGQEEDWERVGGMFAVAAGFFALVPCFCGVREVFQSATGVHELHTHPGAWVFFAASGVIDLTVGLAIVGGAVAAAAAMKWPEKLAAPTRTWRRRLAIPVFLLALAQIGMSIAFFLY